MNRRKFWLLGAILAGIAIAGPTPAARADFEVQFSYGGATVLVDGTTGQVTTSGGASIKGANIDTSTPGTINIFGLVVSPGGTKGGFSISATIADSNSPGTQTIALIDLQSLVIKNNSGSSSTLTITAGDTGFTQPNNPQLTLQSTIGATAKQSNQSNATIVFNSYVDGSNAQFGTAQGAPTINLTVGPGHLSDSGNSYATVTNISIPFSLTEIAQVTLANGETLADGSSGVSVVTPEPSSMALAGFGAIAVLGYGWRRRKTHRRS
jgi:hypothetical protein